MHESALADAVVRAALEAATKAGLSHIDRIDVRVGQLQRIERELFEFALKEVLPRSEPRLASTVIEVALEPARFRCRPCGRVFDLDDAAAPTDARQAEAMHFIPELAHAYLRCPACRSPDFEVVQGRGVSIGTIEGRA